jgi:hypothetical protein
MKRWTISSISFILRNLCKEYTSEELLSQEHGDHIVMEGSLNLSEYGTQGMHKNRDLDWTKSWSARTNRENPNAPDWAVTDRCLAATSSTVWLLGLHADMPVMSPMHAEHAGQWILFVHGFKWIARPIDTATGRRQVEEWRLVSRYSCYVMGDTSHNLSQTSIKRTDHTARGITPTILDS